MTILTNNCYTYCLMEDWVQCYGSHDGPAHEHHYLWQYDRGYGLEKRKSPLNQGYLD